MVDPIHAPIEAYFDCLSNSMAHCPNCNHSFTGKLCPNCGSPPALTPAQINQALKTRIRLGIAGLFGILLVAWRYPLLDQDAIFAAALFLIFAPILMYLFLAIRKRAAANLELLKRAFGWCGGALVALVLLLWINGALDGHPSTLESSVVVRKSVSHGRGGTHYTVSVSPSWRPGRSKEKLPVNGETYSTVYMGKTVAIEVHKGALGLPWFSSVSPT